MIKEQDFITQYNVWQFEAILEKFKQIEEWLHKDFPELNLQIEFNNDMENPVDPKIVIKSRIITDKSMDQNDQRLIKNELRIKAAVWNDAVTMKKWIDELYPSFKRSISADINAWFERKKLEGTAL